MIYRQRLVIEGLRKGPIGQSEIKGYLAELSEVCSMRRLIEPVTHKSELYGWAGWVHWDASGAHFYAWERPVIFFSADIYTCRPFDEKAAVEFTREFFEATSLSHKSF